MPELESPADQIEEPQGGGQPPEAASLPQEIFQQQDEVLNLMDHLLSTPDVPLELRKEYYVLWNMVIFGNYERKDMDLLNLKFKEWCIYLKWHIPEQKQGNLFSFKDNPEEPAAIVTDLNQLLSWLEQIFYIQLTRGRDGFTLKELNPGRKHVKGQMGEDRGGESGGISLF